MGEAREKTWSRLHEHGADLSSQTQAGSQPAATTTNTMVPGASPPLPTRKLNRGNINELRKQKRRKQLLPLVLQ